MDPDYHFDDDFIDQMDWNTEEMIGYLATDGVDNQEHVNDHTSNNMSEADNQEELEEYDHTAHYMTDMVNFLYIMPGLRHIYFVFLII